MAQGGTVDARHGDGAFFAKELAGHGRTLGHGDEIRDRAVDGINPRIQWHAEQAFGRKPQAIQSIGGGTGAGGGLAEPPGQVFCGLLDTRHGHTRELACAFQRLD
ncbi:MAG: hypothetical protein ABF296_02640 [Oceanococcaceae bacterium]